MNNNKESKIKKPPLKIISGFFLIIIFGVIIYVNTLNNMKAAWGVINIAELEKITLGVDIILIDVRTHDEYVRGHIPGAISIPISNLKNEVSKLNMERELIVYCLSGKRSARAASLLSGLGFVNVKNLLGGFQNWGGEVE